MQYVSIDLRYSVCCSPAPHARSRGQGKQIISGVTTIDIYKRPSYMSMVTTLAQQLCSLRTPLWDPFSFCVAKTPAPCGREARTVRKNYRSHSKKWWIIVLSFPKEARKTSRNACSTAWSSIFIVLVVREKTWREFYWKDGDVHIHIERHNDVALWSAPAGGKSSSSKLVHLWNRFRTGSSSSPSSSTSTSSVEKRY